MEAFIRERKQLKLKNPILVEGFPGLGYIGRIAVIYLIKQLKAQIFSELYSPYFPYHVIVGSGGKVRLPRARFYYWQNPDSEKNDLILLTGDSQAQTIEGQYDLAERILNYAMKQGVKTIIATGGYMAKSEDTIPKVVCVSTNGQLLKRMLKSGAQPTPEGNPIVGVVGLTLGLAKFKKIDSACLLGETPGHMPDPRVSKEMLRVLSQFLDINIDLAGMNKEIQRAEEVFKKMEDAQRRLEAYTKERVETEGKKLTYIS
ncbi:MAG: uncharacterized protein QG670_2864 [Thermoproteota archaeon]|nr:uncharacterized protein [Thermoproteota archaeon]